MTDGNSSIRMVYVTAKDSSEAASIGRTILDERLAACVNILGPMQSLYRWEGKMMQDNEVALFIKTTSSALPSLIERLKKLHSYECPAISAWTIENGNLEYFDWVKQNVTKT